MITDQSRIAGINAYLRPTAQGFAVNLGPGAPQRARTAPLSRGRQLDVNGIRLLLEHDDLGSLFQYRRSQDSGILVAATPLLRVTVMKELFAGLFADPFRHRVHNVAGYLDLNEGTLEKGRVMEMDGIPTIVSMGTGTCRWVSRRFILPDPTRFAAAAWELATSRLAPANSINYSLRLDLFDDSGAGPVSRQLANAADAAAGRFVESLSTFAAKEFQIIFEAEVAQHASLAERHTPVILQSVGTPLLRAVNLLERIDSIYDLHSLTELEAESSHFRLSETPGPAITRCVAQLDLSAVLVNSPNQRIVNDDIYDPDTRYEYIEFELTRPLERCEARLVGQEQRREGR
jgi:hypothetical protein